MRPVIPQISTRSKLKNGEQVSRITLQDSQGTLDHMVGAGSINPDEPLESMLLTKPAMQVEHGGGQKMVGLPGCLLGSSRVWWRKPLAAFAEPDGFTWIDSTQASIW